jgi:hypothetical protein
MSNVRGFRWAHFARSEAEDAKAFWNNLEWLAAAACRRIMQATVRIHPSLPTRAKPETTAIGIIIAGSRPSW